MNDEKKPLLLETHPDYSGNKSQEIFNETKPTCSSKRISCYWQRKRKKKHLAKYYDHQAHLLASYQEDDLLFNKFSLQKAVMENKGCVDRKRKTDSRLASISFVLNIILLFANATAAFLSGSLSVISAFIDSAMDSTSGILIFISIWAINNTNYFKYPRGRSRLELIAVLSCSIIMGIANIMMIIQSIQSIVNNAVNPDANLATILILVIGCVLKLILMIVCYRHGTPSSKTMALDQRNDILTVIVALLGAFIGDHYWVYADPIGAICVCSFIAFSWFYNAFDNIPIMVGKRAQQENLSRIIRICIEHDPNIKCLDQVMVYHTGAKAIVEIHVVLDETLPLKITHDIIESLTSKISSLPFVERAFVHSDYRCDDDWLL